MSSMQALVNKPAQKTAVVATIPIPEPGPNEIRVKVHSVALNPVDPTASPANHALLLSLGADAIFDYRSPTWIADVKAATINGRGIDYAVDCISEDATTGQISQCFIEGEAGAEKRIAVIRKVAWDASLVRADVVPLYGAAWTGLGHDIVYNGALVPADPIHRAFAVEFCKWLSSFPSDFPVKANPVRLMPGGLERIVGDGFALIGSGKVADREKHQVRSEAHMQKISAEKLVYRIGQIA
ncbi:hypothetical protein HWV62_22998 [Athelia sp. TMB]|nr:hypothetical protein HWV62_22998 [Athelia sp. TMB]